MKDKLAPILLFVFNRPVNTKKTLQALKNNSLADQSVLYIYADGPKIEMEESDIKKIQEVREVIKEQQWCKEVHIIEADNNKGLADSIIDGVTEKVNQHGKVIVLEDDLVTSQGFLQYMNEALNKYEKNDNVMQISGHQFPLDLPATGSSFFLSLITSWGWATWRRAWNHFDFFSYGFDKLKTDDELAKKFDLNGSYPYTAMLLDQVENKTINSWAIRWWWTVFNNNGLALFPDKSLVKNIGYGDDASHTKGKNPFVFDFFQPCYYINSYPDKVIKDHENMLKLEDLLRKTHYSQGGFIINFLRRYKNYILSQRRPNIQ